MANSQGRGTNAELFEIPVVPDWAGETREPYPMWRTTKGRPDPNYYGGDPLPEGVTSGV